MDFSKLFYGYVASPKPEKATISLPLGELKHVRTITKSNSDESRNSHSPAGSSKRRDLRQVRGSKVTKEHDTKKMQTASLWSLSRLSGLFQRIEVESTGSDGQREEASDDFEGATVVKLEPDDEDEFMEENEDTLVQDEIDEQIDFRERFLKLDDPRVKEWTTDEIWLFNKLSARGFEPLMPGEWQLDFPSFPDILFSYDRKQCFVQNLNSSITESANELNALIQAGPRCRDAIQDGRQPEPKLAKSIQRYMRWALRDARLLRKRHLNLAVTSRAAPDESVQSVVNRITSKLQDLGHEWRQLSSSEPAMSLALPTLYGFVIKFSIVAIVTLDATSPAKPVRTLLTMNLQEDGQDVWHALAVAIVAVQMRNFLLQMDREGRLVEELESESDPDA